MEGIVSAQELGKRCRKFRNALGMSQQALAEKMNTTAQNICKYENEGINSVEVFQNISQILGHNLLMNEDDTEGNVGEVGKEILFLLVKGSGYYGRPTPGSIDVNELMTGRSLFGLPVERIRNEIFKLESIGLCVREQFKDFYDEDRDWLFITAKGVLTLKHFDALARTIDDLEMVQTYESICEGKDSYQEVINEDEVQKLIRKLKTVKAFRLNFIEYLHKTYEIGLGARGSMNGYSFFPGNNCFYDIMFSMAIGLNREEADRLCTEYMMDDSRQKRIKELEDSLHINDPILNDFDDVFSNTVYRIDEHDYNSVHVQENNISEELGLLYDEDCEAVFGLSQTPESRYLIESKKHNTNNPLEWFSKEEIEQFIDANIRSAQTEEEIELNKELKKIVRQSKEVLEYFRFPYAWEQNGLADRVRSKYNYW